LPRLIARDYRALAARQNRAAWLQHEQAPATAIDTRLEDSADRAQAHYLQARRDRLAGRINDIVDCPDLFWRHDYFRHCSGGLVVSADEAVDELRRVLALERRRLSHWSRKPERIAGLAEALVFARYFRRFAGRVWMREAA
jgi:hypothetical protein